MDLDTDILTKADRTAYLVSKTLNGLDFAITGSYAHYLVGGRSKSHFSNGSDIDITLNELIFSEAGQRLRDMSGYQRDFDWFGYDGGDQKPPIPRPQPVPQPHPPRHHGLRFIVQGLLPIHLIQTLKPEQANDFILKEGIIFLPPHYCGNILEK